jgi:GT2 family glycosyltransferase/predicted SAM-dependent methyltransferase
MSTLGFNVIVDVDRSTELEACLKSVTQGPLLDEIIVTIAAPHFDKEIEKIAKKFTDKIYYFKWNKNFSSARNFCLDKLSTDYVFWLDSDDIISPENFKLLQDLKPHLDEADVYLLTYNYSWNSPGIPCLIQPRERIFRRIDSLRWSYAIHEVVICLSYMHRVKERRDIAIDHHRNDSNVPPLRNIEILREQRKLNPEDPHYHFYLGRDLLESGHNTEEGIQILEDFFRKNYGYENDRINACLKLAEYYKKDYTTSLKYAFQGISRSTKHAEFYILLGSVYAEMGNYDRAIQYYEEALTKDLNAGFCQTLLSYRFNPAISLSFLYHQYKHDPQHALHYNEIALQTDPTNQALLEKKKQLIKESSGTICKISAFSPVIPVDIIIPTYNNLEYLRACLNSIEQNTDYPHRIIISDAGSKKEVWDYLNDLKGVTVIGNKDIRLNFSQACNKGIDESSTKYFVLLNSDVIVSKGWLENLVQRMEKTPKLGICGVLSNCDKGWLHGTKSTPNYRMILSSGLELIPGMTLSQIPLNELYDLMEKSNLDHTGEFTSQPWIAFYACIFSRRIINEVGKLDETFKNGCEDYDLCFRMTKYGYSIGQDAGSFVFHYGGVSRSSTPEFSMEENFNKNRIRTKWSKKKIVIYTGPALEKWDKRKVSTGMGGSETWAARMAEQFSLKNYDVTVYADIEGEEIVEQTGERYRPYSSLIEDLKYDCIDYFIASRTTSVFMYSPFLHALKKYVMIHDIWMSPDPNYDIHESAIDGYVVLSDWHKEFVMKHHRIPEHKILKTFNGIDQQFYEKVTFKRNKIFYSSSPDRGLYELLQMFPKIRAQIPDLELVVAYGFYNWEKAIELDSKRSGELKYIEIIKELLKQPGIRYVGRISKEALAKEQMECKAWLYPTAFQETFCCSAVEAGLAQCAILSTKLAGLNTTVGDSGILLEGDSRSSEYQGKFIEEAVRLLNDDRYRSSWAMKAYQKMKDYRWNLSVEGWERNIFYRQYQGLNLGCKDLYLTGFINIDWDQSIKADLYCDVLQIKERFFDGTIDFIYAGHILEHLSPGDDAKLLKICHDLLKPGGSLVVVAPDYGYCRANMGATEAEMMLTAKGEHKNVYDKEKLENILKSSGFKDVIQYENLLDVPHIFKTYNGNKLETPPWQIAFRAIK